ncbi:Scr1 family TA system antitoxin-like transcriptional regulator [Streptomyces sp. NPDC001948]
MQGISLTRSNTTCPGLSCRQDVPFAAGFHLGVLSGAFGVLRFPRNRHGSESEPPTVYADGFTGDLYLDKPAEVARYNAAFADICTKASDEQASRRLISEVAGSYEKQ